MSEGTEVNCTLELPTDRMGGALLKALVDEVRTAPAHWAKMSEAQQSSLINRLRQVVRSETAKAAQLIAKGAFEAARVKIESVTVKDGAKCVLQVGDAVHDVVDYVGQSAVLVMCDAEQYFAAGDEVKADSDQGKLPLEQSDGAPAGSPVTDDVAVGDEVRFRSEGADGAVRRVRAVYRDVDPPEIEVTGKPERFAIALFEAVVTDPIAEVEAEEAAPADETA